jgi:hemerythrin-like metal-binding protein
MLSARNDALVSVGVAAFDAQHVRLLELIRGLHQGLLDGVSSEVLKSGLDQLVTETMQHFRDEEWLFGKTGYPAAATHLAEHEDLTRQIIAVQAKYSGGAHGMLTLEFMDHLYSWLTHHIATSDFAYGAFLNARDIR